MEIVVKENYVIRSAYSHAKLMRYLYIIPIMLFLAGLATYDIRWIFFFSLPLLIFGYLFLRPLRISVFSDDAFISSWPRKYIKKYDKVRRIINLCPYEENLFFIIIIYKKGFLFRKINLAWIPTNQGILEHLKSRGVKVWNFWFWQEK